MNMTSMMKHPRKTPVEDEGERGLTCIFFFEQLKHNVKETGPELGVKLLKLVLVLTCVFHLNFTD